MNRPDEHAPVDSATPPRIWVVDREVDAGISERLADARKLAHALGERVGALVIGECPADPGLLIAAGADLVCLGAAPDVGQNTFVSTVAEFLARRQPRVALLSGDAWGRETACRLAARLDWRLASPALVVEAQARGELLATVLDESGKRARRVSFDREETVIATIRTGVGEALAPDAARAGAIELIEVQRLAEGVSERRFLPADPAHVDIRHARRLVAGGRGLGGRAGFDRLRQIAEKLGAGVAASRAAVDAGWIEYERQVGQTGKTVTPDLYIACGISGASHHLEGMSESSHVVAINSDPAAPIHQKAHLALVADLYQVLEELERELGA